MNNNELASLIGTIIAILPDIEPGYAKEQLYRAASKAVAEADFGTTFMADSQNELYRALFAKKQDFEPILGMDEREAPKQCGCPSCILVRKLEASKKTGSNIDPLTSLFNHIRNIVHEEKAKRQKAEESKPTDTTGTLGSSEN